MATERTNTKTISNEEIIAALLQHGTMKDAAAAAGTTARTIYDRMNDKEFRAEYMAAKNDIIRKAVFTINEKLSAAVDTITEIMSDSGTNPAVRLQAAQTILNNASKFAERLAQDETKSREENSSLFDFDFLK